VTGPYGPYLPSGTQVRYDGGEDGPEYGVVVHCWLDPEHAFYDCYVAFFGAEPPAVEPAEKPYILRYASTSLTVINAADTASCSAK
jgi:hypothetical protein